MTTSFRARCRPVVFVVAGCFYLGADVLLACPVCFQMEDGAVADGVRAGVLVLAGITTAVLSGIGLWWLKFFRRAS